MAMRSPPFVCLCHVPPLHDVTARLQMPGLTTLEIFLTFLRILCHHPLFQAQPYQLISLAYLPLNRTKESSMVSGPAQSSELDIRLGGALGALCSALRNALNTDHPCAPYSALVALYNPHLFSSLILVDPVITIPQWPGTPVPRFSHLLSLSALPRRNGWSSRYHLLRFIMPYLTHTGPGRKL